MSHKNVPTAKTANRPEPSPVATRVPFAFVHINKCGGSSVEIALGIQKTHATAADMRDDMGREAWNRCFTFSIVRHPYDRVVSIYYYRVRTGQPPLGRREYNINAWIEKVWSEKNPDFIGLPLLVAPASDWLCDSGDVLVDYVAKLETLDSDWPQICRHLGIGVDLYQTNWNMHPPPDALLTDRSRNLIADAFAEDFERFGYER